MHCNAKARQRRNQAWRLCPAEAFTSLYGQITMNRWDREGLSTQSRQLLEQLAGKVPVYHLACDISEDAVKSNWSRRSGPVRSKVKHMQLHCAKSMIQKREKHA